MLLRKATPSTETGESPTPEQRAELSRLMEQTEPRNTHLITEMMRPSAKGRRYKNSPNGIRVLDGPFTESKELIGGYVVVSAESLDAAGELALMYIDAVQGDEVDVRELE